MMRSITLGNKVGIPMVSKTSQVAVPLSFLLTARGTGADYSIIRVEAYVETTISVDGDARLYDDDEGTGEATSKTVTPGAIRTFYVGLASGTANLTFDDEKRIKHWGYQDLPSLAATEDGWETTDNSPSVGDDEFNFTNLQSFVLHGVTTFDLNLSEFAGCKTLRHVDLQDASTELTGDVANLPQGLISFIVGCTNTVSGTLSNLPAALNYIHIAGGNTISGDVGLTPSYIYHIHLAGANTVSNYTSRSWPSYFDHMYLAPDSGSGLSTAEVDELIQDLAVSAWTIGESMTLNVGGNNSARSGMSTEEMMSLEGMGVTVTANTNSLTLTVTATGTGAGVAKMVVQSYKNTTVTLNNNAKFYDNAAGTENEGTERTIVAGTLNTFYVKNTSGAASMVFADETLIERLGNEDWEHLFADYQEFFYTSGSNMPVVSGTPYFTGLKHLVAYRSTMAFTIALANLSGKAMFVETGSACVVTGTLDSSHTNLIYFTAWGESGEITMTTDDLPPLIEYIGGSPITVTGDVADLPSSFRYFISYGDTTGVYGDIKDLPAGLYCLYSNQIAITGDLADLPPTIDEFGVYDLDNVTYSGNRSWPYMYHFWFESNSSGLSSSEVDQLLIDLSNADAWFSGGYLWLWGTAMAAPTSYSAAAQAKLISLGVYLYTN